MVCARQVCSTSRPGPSKISLTYPSRGLNNNFKPKRHGQASVHFDKVIIHNIFLSHLLACLQVTGSIVTSLKEKKLIVNSLLNKTKKSATSIE